MSTSRELPSDCAAQDLCGVPLRCLKGLLAERGHRAIARVMVLIGKFVHCKERAVRQGRLIFVHLEPKYHIKMPPSTERGLTIKFN